MTTIDVLMDDALMLATRALDRWPTCLHVFLLPPQPARSTVRPARLIFMHDKPVGIFTLEKENASCENEPYQRFMAERYGSISDVRSYEVPASIATFKREAPALYLLYREAQQHGFAYDRKIKQWIILPPLIPASGAVQLHQSSPQVRVLSFPQ